MIQAKQLLKLFDANLTAMVNGLIKILPDKNVDLSFIDKILVHRMAIDKDKLLTALDGIDKSPRSGRKGSKNRTLQQ